MTVDIRQYYQFAADAPVVVDVPTSAGPACRLACLEPGQALAADRLTDGARLCYVLEGTGLFLLGESQEYASAGGLLTVAAEQTLAVRNHGVGRLVVLILGC